MKDSSYIGRYNLLEETADKEPVVAIGKLALNLIFHTKSKVGFARYTDGGKQAAQF